jgi:hypothetical protein
MSWDRATTAKALAAQLEAAISGVTIYDRPLYDLNAPAIVIGRPLETRYAASAFGVDLTTLPVACVAGTERDDDVSDLIAQVRAAVAGDVSLGGTVAVCVPTAERNWRPIKVGGADLLAADVVLEIQQ